MDKNALVVLETTAGTDGERKGLLFDPGDRDLPFVIAYGFDEESLTWRNCGFARTAEEALVEFKQLLDPEYVIRGITARDVIDAWGEEYSITPDAAREIALEVNEEASAHVSADTEEVRRCVEDVCQRVKVPEGLDPATSECREETLVSGTMFLDVQGYDYVSSRESVPRQGKAPDGPLDRTACFVSLEYSMSLVEEEMAKEGIPLTQPNVAFMSDKIASALRIDAQENAPYIIADTVCFWRSSCPDMARPASPSVVAERACATARASSEGRILDFDRAARQGI